MPKSRLSKPKLSDREIRAEKVQRSKNRWLARRYREVMRIIMEIESGQKIARFTGAYSGIITDLQAAGYSVAASNQIPGRNFTFWEIRDPRFFN